MMIGLLPMVTALPCNYTVSAMPGSLHAAADHLVTTTFTQSSFDYTICLVAGDHVLSGRTLHLNETHNPRGARIIWRAAPGAVTSPRISGGVQLTKWLRCMDGVHCKCATSSSSLLFLTLTTPSNRSRAQLARVEWCLGPSRR